MSPEEGPSAPALPPARSSPDSVLLEVAYVRVPLDQEEFVQRAVQQIDQQHLSLQLRRRLEENGISCGLAGTQLPKELQQLLEAEDHALAGDGKFAELIEGGASRQQLHSRTGKRSEIVVAGEQLRRVMLWKENGRMAGQTFDQAQCFLTVKTRPLSDGRVFMELTPAIKHGDVRQHYVGRQGRFLMNARQEEKSFDSLRIQCTLAPGETLFLTAASDWKGLGRHFFMTNSSQGRSRKIVLIRLAGSSFDAVFAPEQIRTPLATPVE